MDQKPKPDQNYRIGEYDMERPPARPHYYEPRTWIGNTRMGITADNAFEALLRHAAPGQDGRRIDDGKPYRGQDRAPIGDDGKPYTDIPLVGRVTHEVFPDRRTVVNTTKPGHWLHPGNIHRSIAEEGDDVYVQTRGFGVGRFPSINERLEPFWNLVDEGVLRRLLWDSMDEALLRRLRARTYREPRATPPSRQSPTTQAYPLSNLGRIPGTGNDGDFGLD